MTTRTSEPQLRQGHPIWLSDTQSARQSYPSLRGRFDCEVAIVGGGITGALAALTFATSGVSVAIVEAALVGRGSTAASSALLLQEPDQSFGALAQRYGRAASGRIWELGREAVRDLVATLRQLEIDCDLVDRDAVYYATTAEAAARLRREFAVRTRAGFDSEWLTPAAIRRSIGFAGEGAIRTRGSAQFDPYKACVGVVAAAQNAGATIFERSKVRRIDQRRGCVRLHTERGTIDAGHLVVATGYATERFRPLVGRFRMYHTYVLATPRLTSAERRCLGFGELMAWDTERPYHYVRWTPDHRLLLGGGDRRVRPGVDRDRRFERATSELRHEFEARLPPLANVGIERAWEGLFAMTPDSLPYIGPHQRYPRHLFALGYGGNGMTFGFLAARMLFEQWQGIQSADHRLFRFGRFR